MTNEQYRTILEKLSLSARAAAPFLGISARSSQRLAAGDPIPGPVARLMRLMSEHGIEPELLKDLD